MERQQPVPTAAAVRRQHNADAPKLRHAHWPSNATNAATVSGYAAATAIWWFCTAAGWTTTWFLSHGGDGRPAFLLTVRGGFYV